MSTLYQIRHVTRHRYKAAVSECFMEVRKRPLSEGQQRCLNFKLEVEPNATIFSYQEEIGNTVHHFNVPQPHRELSVTAEAMVEVKNAAPLPQSLDASAWETLADQTEEPELLDYLLPSPLIQRTERLETFHRSVASTPGEDPLSFLRRLNAAIAERFTYVQLSTQVDSPIDQALESQQGVCQDFAHIMVGVARLAGIPARYVSGYLYHRQGAGDRSSADASHAWMEAYLPDLGWLGFDPTNNILVEERHIRVCLGRDYKDVPPTRGVYRGTCPSELSVAVQVHPADLPNTDDEFRRMDESDMQPGAWEAEFPEQAQQ